MNPAPIRRLGGVLLATGLLAASSAQAAPPPVTGALTLRGQPVTLTHVLARLHDNAEGVVTRPLRIVVADRPIPPNALDGLGETVAQQLALQGRLRGVLVRIDPARPDEASMVVLDAPAKAGGNLVAEVIGSKARPAVTRLAIGAEKVGVALVRLGSASPATDAAFALKLEAPITREPPVTADLKGPAIAASPLFRAAQAYGEAMRTGDVAAQTRLGSRYMAERMAMYPDRPAITEALKAVGAKTATQLARVHRIVERGDRATLLIDDKAWITMVKEGGQWRSGD